MKAIVEKKMVVCDIEEDIANRLDGLMQDKKLSAKALGYISGTSDMTILRILKQEQKVSIDVLFRLCLAMDITLTEFFNGLGWQEPEMD